MSRGMHQGRLSAGGHQFGGLGGNSRRRLTSADGRYHDTATMNATPSPNGPNGRDAATGRFAKGWKGGPGNPHAQQVAQLRSALLEAVTPDDVKAVAAKLVEMALGGDLAAIREVLDRTVGRAEVAVAQHQHGHLHASVPWQVAMMADEAYVEADAARLAADEAE